MSTTSKTNDCLAQPQESRTLKYRYNRFFIHQAFTKK